MDCLDKVVPNWKVQALVFHYVCPKFREFTTKIYAHTNTEKEKRILRPGAINLRKRMPRIDCIIGPHQGI
jgi:hypothetical protein